MLNVSSTGADGCLTFGISGELALESVDLFTAATTITLPGTRCIILDCEELTFIDSTGVNALLRAALSWKQSRLQVEILSLHEDIREMLDVLGFFEALDQPA